MATDPITTNLSATPARTADVPAFPRQAETDEQLIRLWLHGRPANTTRAYTTDAERFRRFTAKPLRAVTVGDVQGFADSLDGLSDASRARALSSIKSLLGFAHRIGFLPFDVGRVVRLPKPEDRLNERILTEDVVLSMIALESARRNKAMLRLLYGAGLRISELCGLRWRHVTERDDAVQLTIHGKGGKTRHVLLSTGTTETLMALRDNADTDRPVFVSRKGTALSVSQAFRIVRAAARRAGVEADVSPHWLRHAHASHALDRGCPAHLLRETLGHASLATTSRYSHARPTESSAKYLAV